MNAATTTTATTTPPPPDGAGAAAAGGAASTASTTSPDTNTALGGAANGAAQTGSTESAQQKADGELTLKFPDGFTADTELVDGFKALAKESGLKGESAQKFADLYVKAQQKAQKQTDEKLRSGWDQQHLAWKEAQKADKEFGGAALSKSLETAKQFLAKFGAGDAELTAFLNSPYGDAPFLVRLFAKAGKAIAEDSSAGTASGGPTQKNDQEAALRLQYPSMFPKE